MVTNGVAVYASRGGVTAVTYEEGLARRGLAMSVRTPHVFSCALKPLLAYSAAELVLAGDLSFDDHVGRYVSGFDTGWRSRLTVRHLLQHTSGLSELAVEWPPPRPGETHTERLSRGAREARLPAGWAPGAQAAYSVSLDWQVLGEVVSTIHNRPIGAVILKAARVFGMATTYFGVSLGTFRYLRPRLGDLFRLDNGGRMAAVPLDYEALAEAVPGANGVSSVLDLGRMYEGALGHGPAGINARAAFELLRTSVRPDLEDLIEGGDRPYALGLAVDMPKYFASPVLSSASFGHAAFSGAITGLADPSTETVVIMLFNDVIDGLRSMYRRRLLMDQVMQIIAG